jgi:hypothetical protein
MKYEVCRESKVGSAKVFGNVIITVIDWHDAGGIMGCRNWRKSCCSSGSMVKAVAAPRMEFWGTMPNCVVATNESARLMDPLMCRALHK